MKRLLLALAGLAGLAAPRFTPAQPGGPDINAEFAVTPAAGPWMILASSYTGPMAAQMAHELVLHIRNNCKLPAYVFNRGKEEREKQAEEIRKMRKLAPDAPVRTYRIEDQYAVLIGGYKDMETARKALDDIRKLPPPDNRLCNIVWNAGPGDKDGKKGMAERAFLSPFKTAFVVRNPTVPAPPPEDKPDPFLKELNAGEKYSLFKCGKPWTLAIKDYYGSCEVQNRLSGGGTILGKIGGGKNQGDLLAASALQAHELARILREHMHLEAYVLHTRNRSVVSVGGFDSADDPKLIQMQQQLAKLQFQGAGAAVLQLWPQPLPMQVPK
jgi:hypothetical protein